MELWTIYLEIQVPTEVREITRANCYEDERKAEPQYPQASLPCQLAPVFRR